MFQDFPEYYVTDCGKLMSSARSIKKSNGQWQKIPEKELVGTVNSSGYLTVALYGKTRKTYSLHRLIAMALVPGFSSDLDVNHKDGNKLNNDPNNLEWVTKSYNTTHAYALGLILPTRTRKLSSDQKQDIVKLKGLEHPVSIAKRYGLSRSSVHGLWRKYA